MAAPSTAKTPVHRDCKKCGRCITSVWHKCDSEKGLDKFILGIFREARSRRHARPTPRHPGSVDGFRRKDWDILSSHIDNPVNQFHENKPRPLQRTTVPAWVYCSEKLAQLVNRLTTDQRTMTDPKLVLRILVLYHRAAWSARDIAQELDMTVTSVKGIVRNATARGNRMFGDEQVSAGSQQPEDVDENADPES